LEVAFEIYDTLAMVLKVYPYKEEENVMDTVKAGLFFHHLVGIVLTPFALKDGLIENTHFQNIASWLLGGAALSCIMGVLSYCFDEKKDLPIIAGFFTFACTVFSVSRLIIFPLESQALLSDLEKPAANSPTYVMLIGAFIFLMLFNMTIVCESIPKCQRLLRCCFDGTGLINTDEPVPRSRDSFILRTKGPKRLSLLQMHCAQHRRD